jgi:hypothetical protein
MAEKKPVFPKVFCFFQKWTFINVRFSKPNLLFGKEK